MSKYAGADWLEQQLKYDKPAREISIFGREVADILGQTWQGLYHIGREVTHSRCKWDSNHDIEVVISGGLSTWDFQRLTTLVILCHDRAIRLCINAKARGYLELMFHPRGRFPQDTSRHHPTMEEAVSSQRERFGLGVKE